MGDAYHPDAHNQPGSQSSPQAFHLPPTLVAHFPALPAPAHPTDLLTPFSTGSTSDLFRAIIKRPNPISLEINGELHSNAADVAIQFAAELRVYRKIGKHSGFVAYLGCVEGLGVVLEWVEGPTLLDILRGPPPPPRHSKNAPTNLPVHKNPSKRRRIIWYNQLVDALVHLHSLGLNHGDLSLLNIHVETRSDAIKLIDFGRSISVVGYPCQSLYLPDPNDPPTPTVKEAKLAPPPAIFRPGGAWVEDDRDTRPGRTGRFGDRSGHATRSSSHGRDPTRPKLFDRSTPSSSMSRAHHPQGEHEDGVALLGGNLGSLTGDLGVGRDLGPPRPVNHASRLLHQAPSSSQLAQLGTHLPITMSRSNRMSRELGRDHPTISRPSSTSPVHTRYHLSSSPMSPRHAYEDDGHRGYDQGSEQDEWMQIDSHATASSTSRDYPYPPSRHDSRDSQGYGRYPSHGYPRDYRDHDLMQYTQSPPPSVPSSRRPSRSPARYPTAAHYANAPRTHHQRSQHRSTSRSRHSRSPPPHHRSHRSTPQHDYEPHHRSHHSSPQNEDYYDGYPDQYSPQTTRGHPRPTPRPAQPAPSKPPPKPEQIHPGSRPFCAPEILRAPSGSSIDSRTKLWIDPILADAYSLGIILVCMDLCKLVDVNGEKQKREDGSFPDLSGTTIFTELIRAFAAPAASRERVSVEKKMVVPNEEDE